MKSIITEILVAVLLGVCGIGIIQAQQTHGAIMGTVSDQTGAYISGAKLTLTNLATGVKDNTVTQESGIYYFNSLDPGTYSITAEATNFQTTLVNSIGVEVAVTTTTNIRLQVGAATQVVTVSGEEQPIDTVDAQVTTTIPEAYIQQLGSSTRDAMSYADMSPGVTIQSVSPGAAVSLNITNGTTANINGAYTDESNYYLDGIDNSGSWRGLGLQFPSPDAVQEVEVTTSSTTAEFGAAMGGAINVITKSGTNLFHGDAFYFNNPVALSANDAANKFNGIPRIPNNLIEVGGTLGGPIIKDKSFFFLEYQRYSNSSSSVQNFIMPGTPAMMQGDFGGLLDPTSASGLAPEQLYDPNYPGQTQPIPNNNLINYISPATGASLIDNVGLNLAKLMPTVPTYGNIYVWQFINPQVNDELFLKIDQNLTTKHRIEVSFFGTNGNESEPDTDAGENVPSYGPETDTANQESLAVRYTWTPTPKLLIESYFSMAFINDDRNVSTGRDLSTLGAVNVPMREAGAPAYLPQLFFNGMTADDGYLSAFDQHNYLVGSTVTWIKNKHEMKFGFNLEHRRVFQYNPQDQGAVQFSGNYSLGIYGTNESANDTGSSLADMLMGLASGSSNLAYGSSIGFEETGTLRENDEGWDNGFFAQDQWKIGPRLTLTPGIRYGLNQPAYSAQGENDTFIPGYRSTLYPNAYLGMAFVGNPGIPRGLYSQDYAEIAPRVGTAWDVKGDGRTAIIRAGVGWFYSNNTMQLLMDNTEQNPWLPIAGCHTTVISNPWLSCQQPSYAAPPTPFSVSPTSLKTLNWSTSFGSMDANGYSSDFKDPYSIEWNIAAEHQFAHHITVTTGYVGNHGFRQVANTQINYAVYNSSASLDPANILSRQPYSNGLYAGNGGAGLYNNGTSELESRSGDYYNGWQTSVVMNPIPSLQVHASYEYDRGETNNIIGNLRSSPTDYNISGTPTAPFSSWGPYMPRDTFKAFYLWEVPFPKKNLWLNRLAGGWHFSGDVHAFSGQPTNILLGYDWDYDGLGYSRPSLSGPVKYSWTKTPDGFVQYLNVGSTSNQSGLDSSGNPVSQRGPWTLPGGGTDHSVYGNAKLDNVFLPGTWSADTALLKDFSFTKSQYFEFRMEGYNIFNHPVWGSLDSTYTDTRFGQLTSISGHRSVQLGLKYYF